MKSAASLKAVCALAVGFAAAGCATGGGPSDPGGDDEDDGSSTGTGTGGAGSGSGSPTYACNLADAPRCEGTTVVACKLVSGIPAKASLACHQGCSAGACDPSWHVVLFACCSSISESRADSCFSAREGCASDDSKCASEFANYCPG